MRESALYHRLRPKLAAWGEYSRVENVSESGMPDIFYVFSGVAGWLETKVVHHDKLYFERFQLPWMRRYSKVLKSIYVLAGFDNPSGTMQVFTAHEILKATVVPERKWLTIDVNTINAEIELRKPYEWDHLRSLLVR